MSDQDKSNLSGVKHVLLVLSGKGGVGKSTVASQVALSLVDRGHKVGILDVDLCGPSIPHMFGLEGRDVHQGTNGWVPVYPDRTQSLSVMSIGFLLKDRDDAVVWRGPKKNAMIKQFLTDVVWGNIDYLIIDTPPGTSDEHLSLVENIKNIKPDGALLITTPQGVSIADVRREFTFCKKAGIPIIGIIENMSGFVCPHCSECTNLFSSGGGHALAMQCRVPFLGTVPIDPSLAQSLEEGTNYIALHSSSPTCVALRTIIDTILSQLNKD